MFKITTEKPEHAGAIETLLDAAFGADRQAKISYSFRQNVERVTPLCLVALDQDGTLAATIRYWPILIGGCRPCCSVRSPWRRRSAAPGLAAS
jgi:predicted N-acetyltransferase YhbS